MSQKTETRVPGFHISPQDGLYKKCRNINNCDFGPASNHTTDPAEAKKENIAITESKAKNEAAESGNSTLPRVQSKPAPAKKKQIDPDTIDFNKEKLSPEEFQALHEDVQMLGEFFKEAHKDYNAAFVKAKGEKKRGPRWPMTAEMFEASQQRRDAYFAFLAADMKHQRHADDHNADREEIYTSRDFFVPKMKASNSFWKGIRKKEEETGTSFDPNPTFNEGDERAGQRYWQAIEVIGSLSGKKWKEIDNEAKELQDKDGISRTEAIRELYKSTEPRKDKPFVYLDIETASRQDLVLEGRGYMERGEFSEIIEVGYTKVHPNGEEEQGNFRLDMSPHHKAEVGTGWEGHGIKTEDIDGEPRFDSPEIQEKMQEVFGISADNPDEGDGSVLVAHNAPYETGHFAHQLKGYAENLKNRKVETLDTKNFSELFVHTVKGNSNQDFMETAGYEYDPAKAHSAKFDADGTKDAFLDILNDKEKYLKGDHENNKKRAQKLKEEENS